MTEYEELREKLADWQYRFDTKPFKDESHYKEADELLSIIAERCWFKSSDYRGEGTDWCLVKEIKKEV